MMTAVEFWLPLFLSTFSYSDNILNFCFVKRFLLPYLGVDESSLDESEESDEAPPAAAPPPAAPPPPEAAASGPPPAAAASGVVGSKDYYARRHEAFVNHVDTQVRQLLRDHEMEVEEKSRKRSIAEADEPSQVEGLLPLEDIDVITNSKFYEGEGDDGGINIPKLHPYFDLPVPLQMLILELPAKLFDQCLDYIEKEAPALKPSSKKK